MLRVFGVILAVAIYIYCIIDVIRTPAGEMRTLPKWLWLILVVLVPLLGSALWLVLGRVWRSPGSRRRRGPLAPDDDPTFLKKLDDDVWTRKMQRRRGEESSASE